MPYHDEEYPGQPLWQSVFFFCCKGVIEGIMVILFFWLLLQVLFTKQLEVHLQILLLVGLVVFCLSLVLGCLLCWKSSRTSSVKAKVPAAPADPVTTAAYNPSGSSAGPRQLCEDTDGDVPEYPSTFSSPAPSEGRLTSLPFADQAQPANEPTEQATSYFSLRRLSSPLLTAPTYKPIHPARASLPALPKLGLSAKTDKGAQRRCTVTGDGRFHTECSRLTGAGAAAPSMPEKPIQLAPLSYGSTQLVVAKPCLHLTMAFCPEQQMLKVTVVKLTALPQRLEDVTVLGSLPPLHPRPTQASVQSSRRLVLLWRVNSAQELQTCELKLAPFAREPQSTMGTALGEVEVECGGRDWSGEQLLHVIKELNPKK